MSKKIRVTKVITKVAPIAPGGLMLQWYRLSNRMANRGQAENKTKAAVAKKRCSGVLDLMSGTAK